jgi:hypothetical protein
VVDPRGKFSAYPPGTCEIKGRLGSRNCSCFCEQNLEGCVVCCHQAHLHGSCCEALEAASATVTADNYMCSCRQVSVSSGVMLLSYIRIYHRPSEYLGSCEQSGFRKSQRGSSSIEIRVQLVTDWLRMLLEKCSGICVFFLVTGFDRVY